MPRSDLVQEPESLYHTYFKHKRDARRTCPDIGDDDAEAAWIESQVGGLREALVDFGTRLARTLSPDIARELNRLVASLYECPAPIEDWLALFGKLDRVENEGVRSDARQAAVKDPPPLTATEARILKLLQQRGEGVIAHLPDFALLGDRKTISRLLERLAMGKFRYVKHPPNKSRGWILTKRGTDRLRQLPDNV